MAESVRIFASSVFGSDLDKWGAWGFTDEKTRDRLAATIGPEDFVLSIGTRGERTPPSERGRLLVLMKIGTEPISTQTLVDPAHWKRVIGDNGGVPRWPYGFPIKSAERFVDPPLRSDVLPRLDKENLHVPLARYYVELNPDEVWAVLNLPRMPELDIYSTPVTNFVSRLRSAPSGPPPSIGTRLLSQMSGPAATYCMELVGTATSYVAGPLLTSAGDRVFKIGYSKDPIRRLSELNAFLPLEGTLGWIERKVQWHDDEINAYAMEQRIFDILGDLGCHRFKGEMVIASSLQIEEVWLSARLTATRPVGEITVLNSAI